MSKLYVAVGIPGSGKSTYGGYLANQDSSIKVVSTDSIREEMYGDASEQGNGAVVFGIAYYLSKTYLKQGFSVYFDATNVTNRTRKRLIFELGSLADECIAIQFTTPVSVCKARNAARKRVVPEEVIDRMAKVFEVPSKSEGFSKVITIRASK